MEQRLWGACKPLLDSTPNAQALASARSLIVNPSTSDSTLSTLAESLSRLVQDQSLHAHHALVLLSDLALRRPHLSPLVIDAVGHRTQLLTTTINANNDDDDETTIRLAAQSLNLLSLLADRNPTTAFAQYDIGEALFLPLCFRPSVSVRSRLLSNAERLRVRPALLLTLFLGFTKDPFPQVRKAALDGLVGLSKSVHFEDLRLVEGCYCRAVELLRDMEDCVRIAAVRVVSEWGVKLVAMHSEADRSVWSDAVFVQLCDMVRDMCVEVRVEAFDALGGIRMVSEDIMLQTLSKKVLGTAKAKKVLYPCSAKKLVTQAASAAGAFVHGIEDEFYEVRRSACRSLRSLTILSAVFAIEALHLLMDVLNDDSIVVRLQALETMHYMATFDFLKVQEMHMHMFLGTLVDSSISIRSGARKILQSIKLPNLEMFKLCIDGLLENLEIYPQDEADVFSVLFKIGRVHGNFVCSVIKEAFPETKPFRKLDLDSTRVAALLVLAISAPLSLELPAYGIPPRVFSYAVTLLGRISRALSEVISQGTLLAYLSHCSGSTNIPTLEPDLKEEGSFLSLVESNVANFTNGEMVTPLLECPVMLHNEVTKSMNLILAKVKDLWPLIQSGCMGEVLRALRNCKRELATFTTNLLEYAGTLAFTLQYIRIVKLLAKVWEHYLPPRNFLSCRKGELDLELAKLDRNLANIRHRFIGLSKEDEMHILELILITCILRLSKVEICHVCSTLRKISTTISHIKLLCEEASIDPSNLVIELEKLLCQIGPSIEGASYNTFLFKKLVDCFSLKQVVLSGSLKHIKAELEVPGNGSGNPLPFISGLPVGIPFEITLYNVPCENRLWLRMTVDEELTQFVFLDLDKDKGCDDVLKFTFIAPFYLTPKAVSFMMSACIGIECVSEGCFVKRCGGPKHDLTCLCQEKDVYLFMGNKG